MNKMDLLHTAVALLASMVLVLAGMVGWLYWQQTRLYSNMNSIIMVINEIARPHEEPEEAPAPAPAPAPTPVPEEEEDDRASVKEEPDTVSGPPPPIDTDTLDSKTSAELRDMLTKRGIPFGKRDAKTVLVSLLKATA
jgi:hypothetical protein